ncbi:MAG: hypothetical protein R3C03_14715 [Pirellulaceae bacterium]
MKKPEDATIRLDDHDESIPSADMQSVVCKICDTRILINRNTAGDSVKCPECYSTVPIAAALERAEQQRQRQKKTPPAAETKSSIASNDDDTGSWSNPDRLFDEADDVDTYGIPLGQINIPTGKSMIQDDEDDHTEIPIDESELPDLESAEHEILETQISHADDPFQIGFGADETASEKNNEVTNLADHVQTDSFNDPTDEDVDEYALAPAEDIKLPSDPLLTTSAADWYAQSEPAEGSVNADEPSTPAESDADSEPLVPVPQPKTSKPSTPKREREKRDRPIQAEETPNVSASSTGPYKPKETDIDDPEEAERERNPIGMELSTFGTFGGNEVLWLTKLFSSIQLLARLGVAIICLTVAYWFVDFIWDVNNNGELETAMKAVWSVMLGLPALLLFLAGWGMLLALGGVTYESGGDLKPTYSDWSDLGLMEYVSKGGFIGFSLWIAALPGIFMGMVILIFAKTPLWLGLLATLTAMMISPLLLLAAHYNGSAFKIISSTVNRFFRAHDIHWLRFLTASVIGYTLMASGILILIAPSIVFCFIGALLQGIGFVLFTSLSGVYAGLMERKIENELAQEKAQKAASERARNKKR